MKENSCKAVCDCALSVTQPPIRIAPVRPSHESSAEMRML